MELLENIPTEINLTQVREQLHIDRRGDRSRAQELVDTVYALAEVRGVFTTAFIEAKLADSVKLDGVHLTSSVLRKNSDPVERVFPYVVTLGSKIEAEIRATKEMLSQFYLDTIANIALSAARNYLQNQLRSQYALEGLSSMAPGSLRDWPIEEQRPLFAIIGDVEASIGVRLTESYLMIPNKSLSGIIFPTDIPFYSCQLCPRENCVGRKAKYNEKQAKEFGLLEHNCE